MDYGTGKRRPFIAPVGSRDGLILASLSPSAITCGPFLKRIANIAGRHILIEHFGAGHGNRLHWSERLRHVRRSAKAGFRAVGQTKLLGCKACCTTAGIWTGEMGFNVNLRSLWATVTGPPPTRL